MSAAQLAVDGGLPVRSRPFPSWPAFGEGEERALISALRSGKWGIGGTSISEFERTWASFQEAKQAVAVASGTAALELSLWAVGVELGDEVILPSYTFVATATAILARGAIPIFADIDAETLLIDARSAEASVTERTRAIVAVHVAGCPADLDALRSVARRHSLSLVEDAAQAHGAAWRGRKVGAIGDVGSFSFQSTKNLNCGEGGAVVTDDPAVAEGVWSLHNVGWRRQGGDPILGSNARITEFQAALLLAQLERLPDQMARRDRSARYLIRRLAEIPGIRPAKVDPHVSEHAWHLYMFRYDSSAFGGLSRAEFIRALQAEGIPCTAGYAPLHHSRPVQEETARMLHSLGRARTPGEAHAPAHLPVVEQAGQDVVWLYQYVLLGEEADMDDVVEAVAKIQRARGGGV